MGLEQGAQTVHASGASSPLRGVIPALITPLDSEGRLDRGGAERLVAHILDGGASGALVLGSTGEVAHLSTSLRRETVDMYREAIGDRAPLIVGVVRTDVDAAVADIVAAKKAGADGVLVAPPSYAPIGQTTVRNFFRIIADASDLPVFAYNIPSFTKVVIEPDTLAWLAQDRLLAGVKDSSRDFEYLAQVISDTAQFPEFGVFVGTDALLLAALCIGAAGAITLTSNLTPHWSVELCELVESGRLREARVVQGKLLGVTRALRRGEFPAAIKAALQAVGICGDTTVAPVDPLGTDDREQLLQDLQRYGIVVSTDNTVTSPKPVALQNQLAGLGNTTQQFVAE